MELTPLYETGTINIVSNNAVITRVEDRVVADPKGTIPSGIYSVIKWEIVRQKFTLVISILAVFALAILITSFALVTKPHGLTYVIPVIATLLSLYKLLTTLIEHKSLNKSIDRYREDLKFNLTTTPPFIATLYINLHKKQVNHNWITFIALFYGGILTLLLWWLKDVNWWIFEFDQWVLMLFNDPNMMSWVFTISLIAIITVHLIFTIQRKKKILDIDSFFGHQIAPASDIEIIRASKNKMWFRIFIISVMILIVIPIVVKSIMRISRRK